MSVPVSPEGPTAEEGSGGVRAGRPTAHSIIRNRAIGGVRHGYPIVETGYEPPYGNDTLVKPYHTREEILYVYASGRWFF